MRMMEKSKSRGGGNYGWLKTRYSFNFADYYNPKRTGFGALLVLNDDHIEPNNGFEMHSHENMEIITIVLQGTLVHKDSTGKEARLTPGEVQVMSAGTGITHSEFNQSGTEPVKLLQIWITPKETGIEPRYDQKRIIEADNDLTLIASGSEKGLYIHQDSRLSIANLDQGKIITYKLPRNNGLFVFVIGGHARVGDDILDERDSICISGEDDIIIEALDRSRILFIEVPVIETGI